MMKNAFNIFRRRQDGGATVESVLWLGFFVMLFGLVVDIAMIFNGQARVLRVVQDANRDFSVGEITSTADLQTRIRNDLAAIAISGSSVSPPVVIAGVVSTKVTVPANQLAVIGFFTSFASLQVDVVADMMIENWEV